MHALGLNQTLDMPDVDQAPDAAALSRVKRMEKLS
jgi:hypothetical protein